MPSKDNISFSTKWLSNRRFLNEVQVGAGKKTPAFQYRLGNYGNYAGQIISIGNCITLRSSRFRITEDSFFNTDNFENFARYVFWTFNESFLLNLLERVVDQKPSILYRMRDLLRENPVAYRDPIPEDADEELRFCYVKNGNLKADPKYQVMFALDERNRKAFLSAVEKKIAGLIPPLPMDPTPSAKEPVPIPDFLALLQPMGGSPENTLEFIIQQATRAGFAFPFSTKVQKTKKDTNPYKFNGQIAAVIDHFQDLNYIYKEYDFVDVLEAYLRFSGNDIPKFRQVVTGRWQDGSYNEFLTALKELKISKHI